MADIQYEPDVTDLLGAPSDAQPLHGTPGFDDNNNAINTAPTEMKLPMHVDPPNAPPRPAFSTFSREMTIVLIAMIIIIIVGLVYQVTWMDEYKSYQPCNKQQQPKSDIITNRPKQSGKCVVPTDPEHGTYIIAPTAKPGESLGSLDLTVNCLPDYIVSGSDSVLCVNGKWSHSYPKCVRSCKLDNNTSVLYYCLVTGSIEGRRICNAYEPLDTVVSPECNNPTGVITLPSMRCINGSWDHVADCSKECGRVTSNGIGLMNDGKPAERGELPWHVGIYQETKGSYDQICGGSLVSNSVVISAAHCFWDDVIKNLPASKFAVAAGKIYRDWINRRDTHAQKSNVKEINIPPHFQGNVMNFQDDIAMLILETPFEYTSVVGPVCLSFDFKFERKQLQHGNLGKVAGWGLTAENGKPSEILKVVELPYVNITQCIEASPKIFLGHITSDKICAGFGNGTALCRGDSGGGLVFSDPDRYYLRGIVSTAPISEEHECNIYAINTFTQILKHKHFIKMHL